MGMSQAVVRGIDDSRRSRCAIMFTDILGFTRLMQKEEQKTIQKLESHRRQLELLHQKFEGRIIQYYGDGSLSVFDSPAQAVRCAMAIQESATRLQLPLKIGLHYGDIVEKGSAVYGDGINVASRIESIGVARSVLFSEQIWKEIKDQNFKVRSLGSLRFKHVSRPIKVLSLVHEDLVVPDKTALEGKLQDRTGRKYKTILIATILAFCIALVSLWRYNQHLNALLNEEITTIGVMPFRIAGISNLDAGFQSGLLENLVTHLSSFYGLQVLSSRATESYVDSPRRPREIGEELGVSHLLYGTCRQGPNDSVRINLELVDVRNGRNVWAKSVNRKPEDFFTDPVDISSDLAEFLEARHNPYKDEEAESSSRLSLTSYRLITEAREESGKRTAEGFLLANQLLEMAIKRDSSLALGYALLSQNYSLMHAYGFLGIDDALSNAEKNGGMALFLDRNLAEGYASNALMQYVFFQAEPQDILDLLQQAVLLRPSYDYAYHLMGSIYFNLQDYEMAANYFSLAIKLNPDEFLYRRMQAVTAEEMGDVKKARRLYAQLLAKFPDHPETKIILAQYYSSIKENRKAEQLLKEVPDQLEVWKARLSIAIMNDQLTEAKQLIQKISGRYTDQDLDHLLVQYYDKTGDVQKVWTILDQAVKEKRVWLKEIQMYQLNVFKQNPQRYRSLLDSVQINPLPVRIG
jgi:adenylate cyclase